MKFARFMYKEKEHYGVVTEDGIKLIEGEIFGSWEYSGELLVRDDVELLAPIVPNKIIGIGANYVGKMEELPSSLPEMPVFFFKPDSSVTGPDTEVIVPESLDEIKFESELAAVIGREMKNVPKEEVLDFIFGYTIGNDVTAPQFFHENGHWTLGKAFDTFTPIGPVIETELDPSKVHVRAEVNGEEKQNSLTELMVVPLKDMIAYLSKVMTLQPGDVILTGSPLGADFVKDGDVVECKIDEIGTLRNTFVKAPVPVKS
ncbi:fumarylacetoacetate hydrolase family protein [Pseudalkalibacillus salsuginis]|uniref:fumarylacetoacetate hydrolase family protein n=1 Tax=Pseudalkalibacillus salsuginis TaxID=2910972 RepID=UPI001F409D92|nr:fumarylacetoacetate hydrolase family protein [Pseudalkalibacillus salsuginis]MCF6410175.1 fumarylacetoacetate hydrolase family protein [Pseudalkalibacillus salsuginis]